MNYIKTNKPKTVRLSYCLIIGQFTNGAKQNGKAECKFAMLHTWSRRHQVYWLDDHLRKLRRKQGLSIFLGFNPHKSDIGWFITVLMYYTMYI